MPLTSPTAQASADTSTPMPLKTSAKSSKVSEDDESSVAVVTPTESESGHSRDSSNGLTNPSSESSCEEPRKEEQASPESGKEVNKEKDNSESSDKEAKKEDAISESSGKETKKDDASPEVAREEAKKIEESGEKKDKVKVGMLTESKSLYAKLDSNGRRSWSDKLPDDIEDAAENEETQKFALIVRKAQPKEADSTKPLVINSIVVQSPHLKKILYNLLKDYPGITTQVTRLILNAPFECFVHRWDQFIAAQDDDTLEPIARDHLNLLLDILKEELGDIIQLRKDYFESKVVSFHHVWTLFPPASVVFGLKHNKPLAVKFKKGYFATTKSGDMYILECKMVDWDGVRMGWADVQYQIPEYLGTVPFTELPCYPLEYHIDKESMVAKLKERGKLFDSLAGFHYKAYKGTALWHPDPQKTRKETVQSRIVIDGANWEKSNPDHTVWLTELHHDVMSPWPINLIRRNTDGSDSGSPLSLSTDSVPGALGEELERRELTDEQLILTSPLVRGYALKNKAWMEFFIDEVTDVEFDDEAFDSLVLPTDQKELILAFAQSQVKYKDAFDDLIAGKGKGIIMLLSGGPGIGKTLTAESVAEEMKVPLYVMSAGDLGVDAFEVENNLTRILQMVANWNAVLLLDECDVFLEARDLHEMQRNRIVSIFLRTLEYYEGILFLTTNRANNIDPAFQSRIHISLEYSSLDAQARMSVWKTFLDKTISLEKGVKGRDAHEVTEAEITKLANLSLNGRQIKNVLKTANLLACHREEKLAYRHIETVLKVERRFRKDETAGLYF